MMVRNETLQRKARRSFLLAIFTFSVLLSANAQSDLKERLEKHVHTLASDSLHGREAGSKYARMASEYIVNEWSEIGIEPYKEGNYLQPFQNNKYQNIIGIIRGSDPELKNEYIVVGAHYDHIGYKVKNTDTIIYNGADDNASGVATLIELGRELKKNEKQLKRSIILVAFDAEEVGLLGSTYFVDNSFVPLQKIKLMISIDMVGWFGTSSEVKYVGSGTIEDGENILLNPQYVPQELRVIAEKFERSMFTATDTAPFAGKGIPTLAVTTGVKSPYHKPEDEAHLIDYEGMEMITEHVQNIVENVSQDMDYRASGKVAKKHNTQRRFEFGISGNVGSNHHHYTDGALDGKTATSFGIGAMSQINFGNIAIRPEVFYEHVDAKHPAGKVYTDNVTVPLSLVLQAKQSGTMGVDIFLGGYYSYRFYGKQKLIEPEERINLDFKDTYYRHEGGVTWGFSFYMHPMKFGYTSRNAFSNLSQHRNADKSHIRNRANYFTLTYIF